MDEKKKLIVLIGAGGVVLLVLLVSLWSLSMRKPPEEPSSPTTSPKNPPVEFSYPTIPTFIPDDQVPTSPPPPVPQAGDLVISGIAVDDFYKTAVSTNANGDAVLAETSTYQIVYLKQFEEFNISIFGEDFDRAQEQAESHFLQMLGIDAANACKLIIRETVPSFARNEFSGQEFIPQFCEHHGDSND